MTGIEFLKAPDTTAGELADIISAPCPPVISSECDRLSCRECWLALLNTGEPPQKKKPSDKRTASDEDGLHPNLVELYTRHFRKEHMVAERLRELLPQDSFSRKRELDNAD